uniref:Peptidase S1 domain-containing protein n=1 Tax=Sinocyclocheilus rhinocerous TaxID=307959 RepID=A0A673K8H1_9TELE
MTIISLLLLSSLLPHLTFTSETDLNGREAKPHSRPYMVSIQIFGKHDCSGFLISDEFVLTAGDSGGPLVCGDTAVGVVSFRDINLCNSPEHPNVYTKISAYLPWIHQIIRNLEIIEEKKIFFS